MKADLMVLGQVHGFGAGGVAVGNGRVLAVGRAEELDGLIGPSTRVLSDPAALILPGLVDAHVHFVEGGMALARVRLDGAGSREEFAAAVVEGAGGSDWLLGGGWDEHRWGGEMPHRDWIDRVAPERPALLHRMDMHTAVANARALEVAGIGPETNDPLGGRIERDATGVATGVLRDTAIEMVAARIPPLSAEMVDRAIDRAVAHALSLGITQIHDMGRPPGAALVFDGDAYLRAEGEGRLGVRVYAAAPLALLEEATAWVRERRRGVGRVRWGAVKAFMDGSLGSATAWFHEPYLHEPGNRGLAVVEPTELGDRLIEAVGVGLHPIVHAIGDRANDELLDQYARVAPHRDPGALPLRVEHAQHLSPELLERFGTLPVAASVQPRHLAFDGVHAAGWLGSTRERWCYPFRSLLDRGVPLGFGSDWTVVPLDPFPGLDAAMTRRTVDGARPEGWIPEERLDQNTAIECFTRGASDIGAWRGETGRLEPGALADITVVRPDPAAEDGGTPFGPGASVRWTIVEGGVAYADRGDGV